MFSIKALNTKLSLRQIFSLNIRITKKFSVSPNIRILYLVSNFLLKSGNLLKVCGGF